jgi:hypothetical protein
MAVALKLTDKREVRTPRAGRPSMGSHDRTVMILVAGS